MMLCQNQRETIWNVDFNRILKLRLKLTASLYFKLSKGTNYLHFQIARYEHTSDSPDSSASTGFDTYTVIHLHVLWRLIVVT